MDGEHSKKEKVREFWNKRATLGQEAGTNDLIAKQLEIDAILKYAQDGLNVLDAGCGNGITAISVAQKYNVDITAFDFSEKMIEEAKKQLKKRKLIGTISFLQGDLMDLSQFPDTFDLIYTERALINLPDWRTQKRVIGNIIDHLAAGGTFVMCENSLDGLNEMNKLRASVGLDEIEPPWHNRYFVDDELESLSIRGCKLESIEYFTSTYYFLSRVVNAFLASSEGRSPEYDSPINKLALDLPVIGNYGQTRLWVWRKQ
jgi:ubiquinone/menaquinone biosynthesis C-methylase UbiE